MTKDEILELIFNEERELYAELQEQRKYFGYDDRGTLHTQAQWGALVNILDKNSLISATSGISLL